MEENKGICPDGRESGRDLDDLIFAEESRTVSDR